MIKKTKFHICQSISGALRNWNIRQWNQVAKDNKTTVKHIKNIFQRYIDDGKKVMPLNENDICKGFSYETGCPGHEVEN